MKTGAERQDGSMTEWYHRKVEESSEDLHFHSIAQEQFHRVETVNADL